MYLDLVIGEFRANVSISFGQMFSKIGKCFKRKKKADTYVESVMPETSADTYEEELINFYDVKGIERINDKAREFSSDLKRDSNGLYDVPPNMNTELDDFMSDVEIIDDSYEKAMEGQLKRVRGY